MVGEGDRERVIEELRRRAAAGQLSADELADRVHRARTVITLAGLEGILLDLPGGLSEPSDRPWALPGAGSVPEAVSEPRLVPDPIPLLPEVPVPLVAAPSSRRLVVGIAGLVAIGVLAVGGLMVLLPHAESTGDRSGAVAATTVPRPEPTAPDTTASTTPRTTVLSSSTTLPHIDGWETLVVGRDIQPGLVTFKPLGAFCGWDRARSIDNGTSTEFLANGGGKRPLVEVLPTDQVVLTHGCGPWAPYVAPATPATTFDGGDWLVGSDVAPGHYRVTVPDPSPFATCFWERAAGFTYSLADSHENNLADHRTVVDLVDGERFSTNGCGTWTLDS